MQCLRNIFLQNIVYFFSKYSSAITTILCANNTTNQQKYEHHFVNDDKFKQVTYFLLKIYTDSEQSLSFQSEIRADGSRCSAALAGGLMVVLGGRVSLSSYLSQNERTNTFSSPLLLMVGFWMWVQVAMNFSKAIFFSVLRLDEKKKMLLCTVYNGRMDFNSLKRLYLRLCSTESNLYFFSQSFSPY